MASNSSILSKVEGVWELLSFDLCKEGESTPIAQPLGLTPLGRIMFFPSGYMSCTLTNPEAAKTFKSALWAMAPDDEIANTARSLTTYCGNYTVYVEDGEIMLATTVDISLDPTWMGSVQTRKVSLSEKQGQNYMTLKPVQTLVLPVSLPTYTFAEIF